MIGWRSLEFRLTAWYCLMLFVGYLALSGGLWLTVRYSLGVAVDDRLGERLEKLVEAASEEADDPEELDEELIELLMAFPEGHLARVRDSRGAQLFPAAGTGPAPIPWGDGEGDGTFRTVETGEGRYRVLQRPISVMDRKYTVLLASSLETLRLVRDRLARSFLIATPLALILCAGGGLTIARRALKPVEQVAEAASDITVSNLSRRIAVAETGDALERLSRTFNEMLERLETSVARIEQFSADASHELRTPISVIRTTAELALRHGRSEDGYRSDLQDIQAEAERLSDLIEVLLTLARKGGESRSIPMSEIDLSGLTAEFCDRFRRDAESKGVKLELDAPQGPVMLAGNEPSLRRLVAALLENALAHTDTGSITVSVGDGTGDVLLSVRDTGEGIPEEALGKIFDRFYRVDPVRSRATGRLGLGLSIASRIAELHGAELTAESRLGEGSCFTVRFRRPPRDAPTAQGSRTTSRSPTEETL